MSRLTNRSYSAFLSPSLHVSLALLLHFTDLSRPAWMDSDCIGQFPLPTLLAVSDADSCAAGPNASSSTYLPPTYLFPTHRLHLPAADCTFRFKT
jgi:hypothetical protein